MVFLKKLTVKVGSRKLEVILRLQRGLIPARRVHTYTKLRSIVNLIPLRMLFQCVSHVNVCVFSRSCHPRFVCDNNKSRSLVPRL